jgi:hypothetical protein
MLSNPLNHGVPNMNGGRPGKGFELVVAECYTDPEGERRVVFLCTNTYILCPAKTWTRLWFDDWRFGGEPYLLRRSTPNVSSTILKVAWGRSFPGQQKARGRTGEVIGWIRSVKPYSGVVDVGEMYPAVVIRNIWKCHEVRMSSAAGPADWSPPDAVIVSICACTNRFPNGWAQWSAPLRLGDQYRAASQVPDALGELSEIKHIGGVT